MAFVKKRTGKRGVHWDACWDDRVGGKRKERSKTFDTKKKARHFLTTIGVRKPSSGDPFKALTDAFLEEHEKAVKAKQREKSTHEQLRQHIDLHIMTDATFSSLRCEEIGTPEVQAFLDRLYGRISPQLSKKVRTTLSHVFSFGVRRGFATFNPVRETKLTLSTRPEPGEAGEKFVLPPKDDLRSLRQSAKRFDNTGRADAVVHVLMFGGLRISELLGLPRRATSLDAAPPKLKVDQRADRYQKIGSVKSGESRREVVLGPKTVRALEHWLKAAPESTFVFPNANGKVWSYSNFWNRFWVPLMNHAGLVTDEPASATVRKWSKAQADFKQPRFDIHMLRHVYASLQIDEGVKPKRLQELMGHSTLKLTMDTYGHLWPELEDDDRAAKVESALN